MRFLSVCSGIEAASVAWDPLGWTPAAFAEIDPFPSSVLAHHYPEVKNHGDFTAIQSGWIGGTVDLLVGGTPCQSFSIAGQRAGLADDRGNLALQFALLAERVRPRWILWENVPGVLSANGGRDFGSILGALEQLGYGWAYRVLDAQHFGVPQRRRRVFLVGHFGDFRRAAAVLFERHSLQGHSSPRREEWEATPASPSRCLDGGREGGLIPFDTTQITSKENRSQPKPGDPKTDGHGIAVFAVNDFSLGTWEEVDRACSTLSASSDRSRLASVVEIRSFDSRTALAPHGASIETDTANTLRSSDHKEPQLIRNGPAVRRLTPLECERLQGFPDDYTLVPWRGKPAPDGPRYKAIGNSMAVPVMRWIGERIAMVDAVPS